MTGSVSDQGLITASRDGSFIQRHQPRQPKRPTGPRECQTDPWTGAVIARYADDQPFSFWLLDRKTTEPLKRAPLSLAWRAGFSPETEWKATTESVQ